MQGGRFFSGFGYLNEVHAHAVGLRDQPLVYQAFFGNQRSQDGVQARADRADGSLFIELGAETGNGDAPGRQVRSRPAWPCNGTTLFAHVGGDFGDNASWRAGASWIDLDAEDRAYDDTMTPPGIPCRECVHRKVAKPGSRTRSSSGRPAATPRVAT